MMQRQRERERERERQREREQRASNGKNRKASSKESDRVIE